MKTVIILMLIMVFPCFSVNKLHFHEEIKQDSNWKVYSFYKGKYPEAVVNPNIKRTIRIVDRPNGVNTIAFIKNDNDKCLFYNVFLLKRINNWFKVAVFSYNSDNIVAMGWINKRAIGIYLKNYTRNLCLFKEPSFDSEKIVSIPEYIPDLVYIEDYEELWLKIRIEDSNNVLTGWIPYEMQCANALSTCS